ncbi:hypothetical protein SDC9_169912 [bioreactor metagenome]|uniref:Uncharacterized protein n=1 Tax=bioreactor metagenome TaxID=1076179 RepID=A0A645G9P8_9ZZZZ
MVRPSIRLANTITNMAASDKPDHSRYRRSHGASAPFNESCRTARISVCSSASIVCVWPRYSSLSISSERASATFSSAPCPAASRVLAAIWRGEDGDCTRKLTSSPVRCLRSRTKGSSTTKPMTTQATGTGASIGTTTSWYRRPCAKVKPVA